MQEIDRAIPGLEVIIRIIGWYMDAVSCLAGRYCCYTGGCRQCHLVIFNPAPVSIVTASSKHIALRGDKSQSSYVAFI
jgi:hypothetical protein